MIYVRPLAAVGSADRPLAGGKAAGLGELVRAGLEVPDGFVVTAEAFGLAMSALDPSFELRGAVERVPAGDVEAIAGVTGVAGVAAEVRARVAAAELPGELAASITAAYLAMGAGDPPVAVRSSATMEDSAEASFAGLQDSFLGVCGADGVLDAVRRCWASLYNGESVAFRRRIGMPERGAAMGVVVQRMVSPRSAGVMFTCSPVTGDRSVVAIEATWGLGSALVSGDVSPDGFTVSKVTGEITGRRVGAKLRLHSFIQNGRGISDQATPAELRGRPCLTDDQVRALAVLARRVEDHYGSPQDIEWALLDEDADHIVLLQSRPETVWAARSRPPVATPKARPSDHVLSLFRNPP
jgi:pyruvate, water dikinase